MPMSGAERQRRYRKRHGHDLSHLTLDLRVEARDQLDRLAWHLGYTVTRLIEELVARAERTVTAGLTAEDRKLYYSGYEDDWPVTT